MTNITCDGKRSGRRLCATLYEMVRDDRDQTRQQLDDMQLSILADLDDGTYEPPPGTTRGTTVLGVPVRIRVEWPNGVPPGFADADAVRDWARAQLAKLRSDDQLDRLRKDGS